MRVTSKCALWILAGMGCWWFFNHTTAGDAIRSYVENGEFLTFEARYTPKQLIETHRDQLLHDQNYTIKDPSYKFYPYLWMEVKYLQANGRTKEGVILWSMVDGEMVIDTNTWQMTHGFEDAINARATEADFYIINTLAAHRGALNVQTLQKELGVDDLTMKKMMESVISKQLVIMRGSSNEAALHFQNPQIYVTPQTKINQTLVTKPYNMEQRISKKYTRHQIEAVAKASFGQDFAVRGAKEVFLPVISIDELKPDGSTMTSLWNAVTGQRAP